MIRGLFLFVLMRLHKKLDRRHPQATSGQMRSGHIPPRSPTVPLPVPTRIAGLKLRCLLLCSRLLRSRLLGNGLLRNGLLRSRLLGNGLRGLRRGLHGLDSLHRLRGNARASGDLLRRASSGLLRSNFGNLLHSLSHNSLSLKSVRSESFRTQFSMRKLFCFVDSNSHIQLKKVGVSLKSVASNHQIRAVRMG